jgi:hypothetical protein
MDQHPRQAVQAAPELVMAQEAEAALPQVLLLRVMPAVQAALVLFLLRSIINHDYYSNSHRYLI